jgi:hypothetical protein
MGGPAAETDVGALGRVARESTVPSELRQTRGTPQSQIRRAEREEFRQTRYRDMHVHRRIRYSSGLG